MKFIKLNYINLYFSAVILFFILLTNYSINSFAFKFSLIIFFESYISKALEEKVNLYLFFCVIRPIFLFVLIAISLFLFILR